MVQEAKAIALEKGEGEELSPPVVKEAIDMAPKIQAGLDWFYFEVKEALEREDQFHARECLGGINVGSHISPLTTELMIPLEQLASANLYAEEDGWLKSLKSMRAGIKKMEYHVGAYDWETARDGWQTVRTSLNVMLDNLNARAGEDAVLQPLS